MIKFLAVGVLNTAAGLGTIFAAMEVGCGPILSNAIGYSVGLSVSFLMNRWWTFRSAKSWLIELPSFLLVFLIAYAANLIVLVWVVDGLNADPHLAQACALVTYTVINYLGCRLFVFRS